MSQEDWKNQENQKLNFILDLKFVPQVILLSSTDSSFQFVIDLLMKKIVCQKQFCQNDQFCNNCQKIVNNCYFDLIKYNFNKLNPMKKQDVTDIINHLLLQSLEPNSPKICLLETIEYSSLEASNSFLKFLENVPDNTFLILTTNKIEKILSTIKSRCQIFDLPKGIEENNSWKLSTIATEQEQLLSNLLINFINNDNDGKFNNNFFLIKKIVSLKENLVLFFQSLLELTQNKIAKLKNYPLSTNEKINNIVDDWNNQDQNFLINLVTVLIEMINKINNVKNLNSILLLNSFFITIYQGLENDKL